MYAPVVVVALRAVYKARSTHCQDEPIRDDTRRRVLMVVWNDPEVTAASLISAATTNHSSDVTRDVIRDVIRDVTNNKT